MKKTNLISMLLLISACSAGNVKKNIISVIPTYPELENYSIDASRAAPIYPMRAARKNIQGWCDVSFTVLANGETTNNRVVQCSPEGYFEHAAYNASKNITLQPLPESSVDNVHYVYIWKFAK